MIDIIISHAFAVSMLAGAFALCFALALAVWDYRNRK